MKILFLSLLDFKSIEERNIYTDLLREFRKHDHEIYVVSPIERRKNEKTHLIKEDKATILKLRTGNIQKTNIIEKGVSTLLIEPQIIAGIKKYFNDVCFDLVLYSTPPITFCNAIKFIKKRDNAKSYLLLKDIFPQNAVDMGMLSKKGIKGILYKYFRNKEKELYRISDRIGCMSQANVEYVLKHNIEIEKEKVEVCPNCIEVQDVEITEEERRQIRKEYNLPLDKRVFVYGGNLGKPQGIPFIIECLESQLNNPDAFFLIIGDGTEYMTLKTFFDNEKPINMKMIKHLPKDDYERLVSACDIGLIFLDYRFTIPNFPSRILSYMQAGLPVIACTDRNTDVGVIISDNQFGWHCISDDEHTFSTLVYKIMNEELNSFGNSSRGYLMANYTPKIAYDIILNSLNLQ